MAFAIELTRPDDLLRLRLEGRNLRVVREDGDPPTLAVDNPAQPAYLIVHFAPQAIAESAYYEATIVTIEPDVPPANGQPPPPVTIEPPGVPGSVPARIAQGSRLVFRVPPQTRLPMTFEGLLDWSGLELNVNAIAAIGPHPTPAQVAAAPAIARPAAEETALELPYRLIVSPTADVAWAHRLAPFTARGRTEVWHTRLQLRRGEARDELSPLAPAPLRAIWSDDYQTPAGINPDAPDPRLQRAAMSPNDRHQIVIKTSAFHGYESEVSLRLGLAIAPGLSAGAGAGVALKYWTPFVPQPFYADQLMLSSLGGWLRSRGTWNVVRKATPRFRLDRLDLIDLAGRLRLDPAVPVPAAIDPRNELARLAARAPLGIDALRPPVASDTTLDLSEWVHTAAQGRDHYVRIVYEGELLPFRHRAALVKVTERKFKDVGGLVVAHLYQRNFIVVREPEKTFADDDRGMPLKKVRLTTLVTPDIASPTPQPAGSRSFWVEVMTSPTSRTRLPFHAVGTDAGGHEHDFTIAMMFLSQSAQGAVRDAVIAAYNDSSTVKAMADRSAVVPGHKIRFAPQVDDDATDNARLATRRLTFALHNGSARLLKAEVNVPQVQELLGTDAPTTIRLYPDYVDAGLDAGAGVFAEIVKDTPAPGNPFAAVSPSTLGVSFTSDQAGGFATPNLGVSTLTSRRGPLAGTAANAVTDTFDPKTFFPKGLATLFGTFDLFDLLLGSALGTGAPRLQTATSDIPGGQLLTATLDWEPVIDNIDLGAAAFVKGANTTLVVRGRIETPVSHDPLGPPVGEVTSAFTGTLNDFTVIVLRVVEVKFRTFAFESRSGAKPGVTVHLDPAVPLKFTGDLAFVEELRNVIPPDLFGAGPSLDVSPAGIRAGFSFTLPPVSVGVFALRDVSLGAALTLPFLDGRPSLDFNLSERPHPFLLSVAFFGGGGFFHLQLDTAGLKIVEAAFEFGATASVDLGVASGGVQIMAGIYFKLERKEPGTDLAPTLTGYLRMGGYLSVLGLIKISLEFTLSFTYDGGRDKAYGRATLTVQVEIVFFSVAVEITVEKAFGGSNGDPTFGQLFPTSETWAEYAEAFA